jgi:hypothetical protein
VDVEVSEPVVSEPVDTLVVVVCEVVERVVDVVTVVEVTEWVEVLVSEVV